MVELDKSKLDYNKLREIELIVNKDLNINKLSNSLNELGNIYSLKIDWDNEQDELILLKKLKNIKFFNGSKIVSNENSQVTKNKYKKRVLKHAERQLIQKSEIKNKDLEKFDLKKEKEFYSLICQVIKEVDSSEFKDIHLNFNDFFKRVEVDFKQSLNSNKYEFVKHSLHILSNLGINNFCYTKSLNLLKNVDSSLFNIFNLMNKNLNKKLYSFLEKILNLENCMIKNNNDKKIFLNHTNDIIKKADELYKQNDTLIKNFDQDKKNWIKERKNLEKEIKNLTLENNEISSRLIKVSKLEADLVIKNDNIYNEKVTKGKMPVFNKKTNKKDYNYDYFEINRDIEEYLDKNSVKILPKTQVNELIKEIFISKEDYKKKMLKFKLSHENMEQFLIRFFQKKFGIKNMVTEWICILKTSILKYKNLDINCYLFKLILDDIIDEDFKIIYDELKNQLTQLLKIEIRNNNKLKNEKFKNSLYNEKIKGNLEIKEIENILKKLVFKDEYNFIYKDWELENKSHLSFNFFENEILKFYLQKHIANLEKISRIFKSFDSDNDGVLDKEEFFQLLDYLDPLQELNLDKALILKKVDHFGHNVIIFSQIINVFSEIKLNYNNKTINIINFCNYN